jgi:hypothetical protein
MKGQSEKKKKFFLKDEGKSKKKIKNIFLKNIDEEKKIK